MSVPRLRLRRLIPVLFAATLALQACASRPTADSVGRFATSLQQATVGVTEAYALTARIERQAAVAGLAVNYVASPGSRISLDPQVRFTPDAIRSVASYLDLLSAYAAQLAWLSGDAPLARAEAAGAGFAQAVATLADASFPGLAPQLVQRGTQGASALARFVVEEKLNRELPPIIDRMHPAVEAMGALLEARMEQLRDIARLRADELRKSDTILLSAFRDDRRTTALERYAAMEAAFARQDDLARVDDMLLTMKSIMPRMVRAHAALRSPQSADAAAAVALLEQYVRRLRAIYEAIR